MGRVAARRSLQWRHNLLRYGIKGTELAWFKSYLTNRTHCVNYDGTNSCTLSKITDVPLGSTLGPLLFTTYMTFVYRVFMSQIVLYFLHSTSVLSFHTNVVLTLSTTTSPKFLTILFADVTDLTSTLYSLDVNVDINWTGCSYPMI